MPSDVRSDPGICNNHGDEKKTHHKSILEHSRDNVRVVRLPLIEFVATNERTYAVLYGANWQDRLSPARIGCDAVKTGNTESTQDEM